MKRRVFIGSAVALAVAGAIIKKPSQQGGPHSEYFASLNTQLQQKLLFRPTMIVDLDRIDRNIDNTLSLLNADATYRVVVKSLPSVDLLGYIMQRAKTNRLMVFHQPFLNLIAERFPSSDVLMGKPMPVGAARTYFETLKADSEFDSARQLQWLIDSQDRLNQYLALAKQLNQKMRINIELDVGLHRGGLHDPQSLLPILDTISENTEYLEFSGFMGYDPHVVKLPSFIKTKQEAYRESQAVYQAFLDVALEHKLGLSADNLCLNGAGSPTLAMHKDKSVCNDLSAGSCIVKPTDFDIPSLDSMTAAAFIATPVIKQSEGTLLPGAESLSGLIRAWDPNRQQTFFIYGGKWMADYVSPPGLVHNETFGFSTNQQIVNGSNLVDLKPDDFVFLRPHQSEFVFLQFGDLRTVRGGKVTEDVWPVFSNATA